MSAVLSAVDDFGQDRQVAQLRIPPHSIESESSVLGGLLLDNSAWDRVGDLLVEGDFYRYEHKLVFAAVGGLINASKPADVITVFEHLHSLGKSEEVGGLAYLNRLDAGRSYLIVRNFFNNPYQETHKSCCGNSAIGNRCCRR